MKRDRNQPATELKIETGIPVPPSNSGGPKGPRNPTTRAIAALKKGQSVLLNVRSELAHPIARRYIGSGNYALRHVDGGVRVWRLK